MRKNTTRMAKCHLDRLEEAKGLCNRCYQRKWAKDNASEIKIKAAKNKEKYPQSTCHPEKKAMRLSGGICRSCYEMTKYYENPELSRDAYLRRVYGISLIEYQEWLNKQNGVCAICLQPSTLQRKNERQPSLHVDHNHSTGELRGLLCFNCNLALGALRDNADLFKRCIQYLSGELNDSK